LYLLKDNEIFTEDWNTLLSKSIYSSVFQTPAFYDLFNSVSGLSAKVFAVKDESELKALCVVTLQKEPGLKGYFSRRAIIYGGPVLIENGSTNYLVDLLRLLSSELIEKSIYLEIRNLNNYSGFKNMLNKIGWEYIPYQNFIIDCSDKEKLFQKFGNNRKRQIKKATKLGVEIKEAENINEIDEYYTILKRIYTEKIKKPLLPKQFFSEFFNRNLGKFLLVRYKGEIIGGIVCPILKGKCIYELYICGLDEEFKDQHPSIMATWAAMNYANEKNIPVFDFMGAGKPEEEYGVREFKARFGGKEVEYGRFLKVNKPVLFALGKSLIKIRQRIK
jgi:serine/alanine adding enzyme